MTTKLKLELTLGEAIAVQNGLKVWRAMQYFNANCLNATDTERDYAIEHIELTDGVLEQLGVRGASRS